jgi:hypothetical protein
MAGDTFFIEIQIFFLGNDIQILKFHVASNFGDFLCVSFGWPRVARAFLICLFCSLMVGEFAWSCF